VNHPHVFLESQRILDNAIAQWQPVALVSLFSGGYDSMIATHILHRLDTHGLPIQVWAIDTQLAADGWHEYVRFVANKFAWNLRIYDNKKGFAQFVESVRRKGCPRTRQMHTFVFQKLKERGFDAILRLNKTKWSDKVLFVSGMRRAESTA
jgi:3''-phosphoadenosine 5''-phosphosulfate sulfotransferase (PAPS reductase)/FAD synthetase and related enzymes